MNIIGALTTDRTFLLLTVVLCSQASHVPLQLANTLLLSPSSKEMSIQFLSEPKDDLPGPSLGGYWLPS